MDIESNGMHKQLFGDEADDSREEIRTRFGLLT